MPTGLIMMNDAVVRRDLWFPITIRVAWDLHLAKVEVRPNILHAARLHAMSHLPEDIEVSIAERIASIYTKDFIQRLEKKVYRRPDWDSDLDLQISPEWRRIFLKKLDEDEQRIFWFFYSDGISVQRTAKKVAISSRKVENSCRKIRSLMRRIALQDNIDLSEWSDHRIDQLIFYVANVAESVLISPEDILSKRGKRFINKCPRIRRAYILLKHGILSPRDLEVPEENELIQRQTLLVLMLHPDARKYANKISKTLSDNAIQINGDVWLIDQEDLPEVEGLLEYLAEESQPPRHQLRGAMVSGPGEWFDDLMLGPLAIRSLDAARSRPWGSIDGIGELPMPLPPPPSSTSWWMATAISGLLGVSSLAWAMTPNDQGPNYPINANFYVTAEAVDVRFDVNDMAYVSVIRMQNGILTREEEYSPVEKGQFSTGDGRYYLRLDAPRIAIMSSTKPVPDMAVYLQAAQISEEPMVALIEQVKANVADVDIVVSPELEVR
jgi:hypothetical protein